ncbi:AAA family ATPase [Mesorhizobium sophorae]|uniref:AAA family ATPase n=1 Tax=Mesorhizobium sophorae TaxID=1300294 RepID=UPI000BA368A4|nr:AAA family ATPase [Mesorhizobium sophorae]
MKGAPIPIEKYDNDPWRFVDYDGKPRKGGFLVKANPFVWREPVDIPPRCWLFGGHYIRGYVTGTVAPGGMGKTSVVQTEALSMVTGRDLLGIKPELTSLNAWIWNLEDPTEEVERRFAASVVHHEINPQDLAGRLFVNSGRDTPLVIARKVKDAITVLEPVIDALVAEIIANGIDVLIVDPFVSSHGLPENDNAAIDAAVKAWGRVAGRGNCSVELVHHARKLNGDTISAESARGGSAFVDGCRAVRVINRMSEDEAARLGIDEARRYFFMLADKQNMAPPADKRDWYQLVSVPLANGDNVAAVDRWTPPNPFDDVTPDHLRRAQALFAGGDFRESEQSPEWGGNAVATVLDLDVGAGRKANERTSQQRAARAKIKRILLTWQDTGAITIETRLDSKRNERRYYACGDPA